MREFIRAKNEVEMKINDKVYTVDPVKGTRMIMEYEDKAPEMLKEIERQKYSDEAVYIFLKFATSLIDDTLGSGSVRAIIGEKVDYYSIVDLYVFIRESVREFNKEKSKEYSA